MKKIFAVSVLACVSLAISAQVDTFTLRNMPGNYFIERWLDYDEFHAEHHHDDGSICGLALFSGAPICYTSIYGQHCINVAYGIDETLSDTAGDGSLHINNFAAGKHTDNPISVAGVALLYPKYYRNTYQEELWSPVYNGILMKQMLANHGYDQIALQLMDSNMNVLAEGSTPVLSAGEMPVFVFNKEHTPADYHYGLEIYSGDILGSLVYDIYEVYFNTPVTVTDSFYLASRYLSNSHWKNDFGFSVPCIYENHYNSNDTHYYCHADFDFPPFTWKARGGFIYEPVENSVYNHIPVTDNEWFSPDDCWGHHGYMLIFPILDVVCGVPEEVSWNGMGGGNVLLRWAGGEWVSAWEVSYGPEGTPPGEGRVLKTDTTRAVLEHLSSDTNYVAYVRSRCTVRDTLWSDWSDSVPIPLAGGHPQGIGQNGGINAVSVQPNPSGSTVLVASEAELTGIEAYTVAGMLHARVAASGREAQLDVSAWPAGEYVLRIATRQGTVTRRLTVAR